MNSSMHPRRWPWIAGLALLGLVLMLRYGNTLAIALESPQPSQSVGTSVRGELRNGKRLPSRGANFRAYSDLGALLGRNTVHHKVRDAVLDAYARLERESPGTVFIYGETGWPDGGPFAPHRSHQNGMAVDFFVPVRDAGDRPRPLPTNAFNRYGYGLEFDTEGHIPGYRIDFPAMAAHLRVMQDAARKQGLDIKLVIFDKPLQDALFATRAGADLRQRMSFSRRPSWVRHDEHYHVVFVERS